MTNPSGDDGPTKLADDELPARVSKIRLVAPLLLLLLGVACFRGRLEVVDIVPKGRLEASVRLIVVVVVVVKTHEMNRSNSRVLPKNEVR